MIIFLIFLSLSLNKISVLHAHTHTHTHTHSLIRCPTYYTPQGLVQQQAGEVEEAGRSQSADGIQSSDPWGLPILSHVQYPLLPAV